MRGGGWVGFRGKRAHALPPPVQAPLKRPSQTVPQQPWTDPAPTPTRLSSVNPDTRTLLAKFEACNNPGCFDAKYEAAKQAKALRCVSGECPPAA